MASSESPNLVSDFEQAYSEALSTLCEEEILSDRAAIEEQKIGYFIDLARQIETFFIQKRFLVYSHKPELILREDSAELRAELQRKDELIRRHYEKMAHWQSLLQDMKEQQQQGPPQNVPSLQPGVKIQPGSPMPQQPVPGPQGTGPQAGAGPGFGQPIPYRMNSPYQTPLASLEKTTTTIGR